MRPAGARQRLQQVGAWIAEREQERSPRMTPTVAGVSESKPRIIYVFDTDVVMMYAQPLRAAEYCALLRTPLAALQERRLPPGSAPSVFLRGETLLADLLGNFFVWGRGEQLAWTTPAHAHEIEELFDAVLVGAMRDIPALEQHLREAFARMAAPSGESGAADKGAAEVKPQGEPDPASPADRLEQQLGAILQRAAHRFPRVAEALRLQVAFELRRIASVDRYSDDGIEGRWYMPSTLDPATGDVHEEIHTLARHLERLLVGGTPFGQRKLRNLRVDAEAIAHLCWLNVQLEGSGRPLRVRFVTGAPHLHSLRDEAGQWSARLPSALMDKFMEWSPALRRLIRHPLGFLDDPEMQALFGLSEADADGDGKLGVWLRERMRDAPDEADGGLASLPGEAATELMQLLMTARARQSISPDGAWISRMLMELLTQQRSAWDETLARRLRELYPRLLASLATLQAPAHGAHRVARNLPPLSFDNFQRASSFCEELYRRNARERGFAAIAKERLTEVIADDRSLYTPLLAIALWRAAERSWRQARAMALAAVEVADRERIENEHTVPKIGRTGIAPRLIMGAEACYLAAAAVRITAGTVAGFSATDDLRESARLLRSARDRLEAYYRERESPPVAADLRLDAEELSLNLSRALHGKLVRAEPSDAWLRVDEAGLFRKGSALLRKAVALRGEHGRAYEVEYVIQQSSAALLQLVLLDRYGMFSHEVFPVRERTWSEREPAAAEIEWVWQLFDTQCAQLSAHSGEEPRPILPTVSALAQGLHWVFKLERARPDEHRAGRRHVENARRQIEAALAPDQAVASIDDARFMFLRKIAERVLG